MVPAPHPPRRRPEWDGFPTTATGRVMAAEANYVRVDIHRLGGPTDSTAGELTAATAAAIASTTTSSSSSSNSSSSSSTSSGTGSPESSSSPNRTSSSEQQQADTASPPPPRRQLLCTVRALLKKVRQRVLVGDVVSVGSIDWAAGRGVVEGVLPRVSELVDPAVANVDHVVLLFGLAQPPVSAGSRRSLARRCAVLCCAVLALLCVVGSAPVSWHPLPLLPG